MKRSNKLFEAQAIVVQARRQLRSLHYLKLSQADMKQLEVALSRADSWMDGLEERLEELKHSSRVSIKRGAE